MSDTVAMPKLGFDMAEGTLVRWVMHEGEAVEKGQVLAEIETDKATVEVESPYSGTVLKHLVEQGAIVPVGDGIAIIGAEGEKVETPAEKGGEEPPTEEKPAAKGAAKEEAPKPVDKGESAEPVAEEESPETATEGDGRVKASPLARRMAEEKGIDLQQVEGSGPNGRIVRKDVESFQPSAPAKKPAAAPQPVKKLEGDETVALDRLRQAIGRRMVESKTTLPHFYVTHVYNAAPMLDLRKQMNEFLSDEERITVNDFFVRSAALALRAFPNLNAMLDGNNLIRRANINIGVAVAVPGGLLTVVVRDADLKPLSQISREVKDMSTRVRSGKVRPEDIEGSTFSLSNLGMFDVEHFAAIINPPEAAILAISSARKEPVVVGDELKVGTVVRLTLSADHRITDGAEAAQFMQELAKYIEQPLRLLS